MTDPSGTVRLNCVVIVPTVRLAVVSALDAASCVRPTTSGTTTCGKPDETRTVTRVPSSTSLPAVGSWLITDPAGTVMLGAAGNTPTDETVTWYVPGVSGWKNSGIETVMSLSASGVGFPMSIEASGIAVAGATPVAKISTR